MCRVGFDIGSRATSTPRGERASPLAISMTPPTVERIGDASQCHISPLERATDRTVRMGPRNYLPGRNRDLTRTARVMYIFTPDQHAIWMTEQLSKIARQAPTFAISEKNSFTKRKPKSYGIYRPNNSTHEGKPVERSSVKLCRTKIQRTSIAVRSECVGDDTDHRRRWGRNPRSGVGHLERWAKMLPECFNDLSENRMPSVAELPRRCGGTTDSARRGSIRVRKTRARWSTRRAKTEATGGGTPNKPFEGKTRRMRFAAPPPPPPPPIARDMESSPTHR